MSEYPRVFLKSIIFNDDTTLQLEHNSIIVFTGANNSGKSQVLKDVQNCFDYSNKKSTVVFKDFKFDFEGTIDNNSFIGNNFYKKNNDEYKMFGNLHTFRKQDLNVNWINKSLTNGIHMLFVKLLSTELRLTSSNPLNSTVKIKKPPILKLIKSETISQKLSDYFRQAFGVDLVANRSEIGNIALHIGQAPDKKSFTMDMQNEYYNKVNMLPKLHDQGDGMRSFASILLETFTSEHSITLIDEPEAFLHPPQARLLGKMLSKNNPDNRQLFISTHSEDFLQGLLDADNLNVTIIRINREDSINRMSVLKNDEIKKLWGNPLLRYSNILSGLFHEKVVVCESDYDCLFYHAIMDSIYDSKNEIAPDILFTHCGGKGRIKDVVAALNAVNVPVVAICDFDLMNSSDNLKPIISAFGIDWNTVLYNDMNIIYNNMNAKNSTGNNSWKDIKKIGKSGFTGNAPAAYEKVESIFKNIGLYIVPVGEMECFDKTINKEKKDWVYHVLENYKLASEPKLENARKFVQEVVDFKRPTQK